MGREVKRVPMDFAHPIREIWPGYMNPHYRACPDCGGSGQTVAQTQLDSLVNLLMMAGEPSRGWHPYFYSTPVPHGTEKPAPELREVTSGLAGREPSFMGHDAIDRWEATKKILRAAGLSEDWGRCQACAGEGIHPDSFAAYEAWESTEPPVGDGWQMWETTSEGSPISPVCDSPESLARWLADNEASAFGGETATAEQWLAMIQCGYAPSMVVDNRGPRSSVAACEQEPSDAR